MQEEGVSLLSVLLGAFFYRQRKRHDHITDYFPPTHSEFQRAYKPHKFFDAVTNPVMLSTLGDGSIVRGLAGIPSQGEGPVLYVGYHMLFGLDCPRLISRFWNEKNISLRALGHPSLFSKLREGGFLSSSLFDLVNISGAVPVSASNLHRLLSSGSHILLFPGAGSEAFHRKGEEYTLFWPEQAEFVRMAAKFGAKIVPFGSIGEDDFSHLLLDTDDLKDDTYFNENIPYFKNDIQETKNQIVNVRKKVMGEVANQDFRIPIVVPKVPGRVYFLLGKPIETQGRKEELIGSREKAHELYLEVKSEVENCLSYLKEKRKSDPYKNVFARLSYQATHGFDSEVPTFDLTTKDS